MPYFAVTVERDLNWDISRSMRKQAEWDAHARFMDALTDDGFVLLGGPVGDGTRVLLAVEAAGPAAHGGHRALGSPPRRAPLTDGRLV